MGFYEKIKEFMKEDESTRLILWVAVGIMVYYLVALILIVPYSIDGMATDDAIAGCIMMNLGGILYIQLLHLLFKRSILSIEKRIEKLEERI